MSNVYYAPEKFGLRMVATADAGGGYDFDMFALWQDTQSPTFYYAKDSGCSCPSPFETFGRDDLTKIERPQDLYDAIEVWKRESYRDGEYVASEIADLLSRYQAART